MLHFIMFEDNDDNEKLSNKLPISLKKKSRRKFGSSYNDLTLYVEKLEIDPSYSAKAQAVA